jgi:hypothetical protein
VGFGFGPLPALGSLTAGEVALDIVSEVCTAGFGRIKETWGVEADGSVDEGSRAGMSIDGGEVEVGSASDGETSGRCSDLGVVVPCGPMLRAATSVVGMGCDSITTFFGVLAGGLGEGFQIGFICTLERSASAWGGKSFSFRAPH